MAAMVIAWRPIWHAVCFSLHPSWPGGCGETWIEENTYGPPRADLVTKLFCKTRAAVVLTKKPRRDWGRQ
jgi:hypothetical protein